MALSSSGPCDQAFSIGTSFRFEGWRRRDACRAAKKAEQMEPKGVAARSLIADRKRPGKAA
jgi:hypothetical protein